LTDGSLILLLIYLLLFGILDLGGINKMNEEAIEKGKTNIVNLIREKAKKQGIEDSLSFEWSEPSTPEANEYEVQVTTSSGQTAYQKFTSNHLTGFQNDNRLLMRVHAKIESILLNLKK